MRLLILTQAVDLDDPILGFMHRWIEEFAKRFDSIDVICLKGGRFNLPANVHVYSLGKESGASRIKYIFNFYRYLWRMRRNYDAVFVHMNQEYVLLGGIIWKILGKRVVLWRNHKIGSWMTRLAAALADVVCYTSPAAYVAAYQNAVIMPIGIDTESFRPASQSPPRHSILFLGRLDPVKRVEVFIDALEKLHDDGIEFTADIVGDPTPGREDYAHNVRNRAAALALDGSVRILAGVTQAAARELFASHAIYVNLTPSGSFDKTIGEAMACGCIVVCANDVLRGIIPEALLVDPDDEALVAAGITAALLLSPTERCSIMQASSEYIEHHHSLALLSEKLAEVLRR